MVITILTDNKNSWFVPYGEILRQNLVEKGHEVAYVFNKGDIKASDILFLLSCTRLINQEILDLNKSNIVVHASDLPEGKGFSPLQWQILEGRDKITLTLFEVVEKVDAGPYYLKDELEFSGTELLEELRKMMAVKIIEMCQKYVDTFGILPATPQSGIESFYPRRTKSDDEIDKNASIISQMNLFRIADNDNYPLHFTYKGCKYILKIFKAPDEQ